ncbi:MAG: iron ABC transporter permease, partial [Pseudolabrys sp.]
MTIALPARSERRGFGIDVSKPVLYGFAIILCLLIILPLSWLLLYSVTDAKGAFTLNNFYRLFTESSFYDPLVTTFILATSSAFICCAVAAPMGWLVARTDLPFSPIIRALVTASFVTPPFLGAIAWELLAAPNSGLLNKIARDWFGMTPDQHLFNIYTLPGIIFVISCYTFP